MNEGELYRSNDAEILKEQLQCVEKLYDYNVTRPSEKQKRKGLLKEMFAVIGDGCHIEPPFHANWGGKYVHFGKGVYANFNLTLVDDVEIYVGDYYDGSKCYNYYWNSPNFTGIKKRSISIQSSSLYW
ncbi:maltose acetyltransferase domain-containing protein [Thomasclavelia ramosa]|uniref:maltose acetyltransferase domain-containing protein n=1 Tax=Thomasclavelia ramosa TaxID=1547 RepID=UPI001F32BBA1|nr:maltose acetyltransferase domain-containing protein [Thomasclavelia ramosa]